MNGLLKRAFFTLFPKAVLVRRAPAGRGRVFLTFDDGPHPATTDRILEVLERHGVKATFFVTGARLREHPEIARRAFDAGHEIASHSWFHLKTPHWGFRALRREILAAEELIREVCGVRTRAFRPPYGRVTLPLLAFALLRRMRIVLWSLDSEDDRGQSPALIVENCRRAGDGDIVLFHDDNRALVEALPEVLRELRARGLGFGLVRELFAPSAEAERERAAA